jgi:imidazolonepropionase-like amidohydrolase
MKGRGRGGRAGAALAAALALALSTPVRAQSADAGVKAYLKDPATAFVLENARVIDGTGQPVREKVTVVIEDGRIAHVGAPPASIPAGAKRIDLTGRTILPGLVMMHDHINYFSGAYVWDSMPGSVPKLLLAAGVTTARTAGSEAPQVDLNLKRRIDAGKAPGPRLFVTGAYLNAASGGFLGDTVVSTAADGREVTAFWGGRGATSIKVYSAVPLDALRGAVEEANRRGMHVAGHLGEISCTDAANAGIHTIEHGLTSCIKDFGVTPDGIGRFRYADAKATADKLIALLVSRKVAVVSTAAVEEPFEPSADELAMLSPDQRERYQEFLRNRPPWLPPLSAMVHWNAAQRLFERDFVAAGGRLLIGGDAMDFGLVPGYANHNAMIALVRGGFTPLQVIKFATSDAANFLGAGSHFGTVAPGMAADLLVVSGAPDRRIEDIRNVDYVFKDGVAYDPAKLRAAARGMLGQH